MYMNLSQIAIMIEPYPSKISADLRFVGEVLV
jgi:hypothetical protein